MSLSAELLGVTAGPAPLQAFQQLLSFLQGPHKPLSLEGLPHVVCPKALEFCQSWRGESPSLSRPQHPQLLIY